MDFRKFSVGGISYGLVRLRARLPFAPKARASALLRTISAHVEHVMIYGVLKLLLCFPSDNVQHELQR